MGSRKVSARPRARLRPLSITNAALTSFEHCQEKVDWGESQVQRPGGVGARPPVDAPCKTGKSALQNTRFGTVEKFRG